MKITAIKDELSQIQASMPEGSFDGTLKCAELVIANEMKEYQIAFDGLKGSIDSFKNDITSFKGDMGAFKDDVDKRFNRFNVTIGLTIAFMAILVAILAILVTVYIQK